MINDYVQVIIDEWDATIVNIKNQLFKSTEHKCTVIEMINDILSLGRVGYHGFSSNMLRKFHASSLYNKSISLDKFNNLQEKAQDKTDAAYFMTNPTI